MDKSFKITGLSSKNTPIDVREKLALNEAESKQLIQFLVSNFGTNDTMVLSTCNRTEVYYNHENELGEEIATAISLIKGVDKETISSHLTFKCNSKATVNHLFEVSLGLQAQVVGDIQISNQVKHAYQWSADENAAGPLLHRLMHTIFLRTSE